MNYEDARKYIDSIARFGSKLGLENIENLMRILGDPQDKMRSVHVAGTNGKGSTVAFLSSILMQAGYRTGMYTSPFVERFSERIRVDGKEIEKEPQNLRQEGNMGDGTLIAVVAFSAAVLKILPNPLP